MNRTKFVVSVAILWLAACATESPPPPQWSKPGAGSEELAAARSECMKQANEPDLGRDRPQLQSQVRGNAFMRRMREQGWEQVPGETSE